MRNKFLGGVSLLAMILRAPDDGSGAGDPPADPPKAPENVLFPDDKKPGDPPPAGDDKKPDEPGAGDWKEYVPDPNKSDEENDAAKAEHDKTKPVAKDDKSKDPLDAVPEDGKYTLTMPEGVELDNELLDAISVDLKAKGYTTREAQGLADKFIKVQQDREAKRVERWANTIQQWADDAKADKEIGGDKWDATVLASRRAVDTLGTPALKDYLNATGGGNHPELIRFMAKVGAMVKEDNPPSGGAEGAGKPADPAHVLFPNDIPKGG